MVLIGYTEFRSNLKKYLQLSLKEKVVIKNSGVAFEIVPSKEILVNPSPSNDKYFENRDNLNDIELGKKQIREGKCRPWSEIKAEMGL